MLSLVTLGLFILAIATWRMGGPIRALCIGWLVCLTPVALGIVSYDFLAYASNTYVWLILAAIGSFVVGAVLGMQVSHSPSSLAVETYDWNADFERWWPVARVCVAIAALAVFSMFASAYLVAGQLGNLGALREQVVEAESANIFARLGAVTIWACFFCYAFALFFRHLLSRGQLIVLFAAAIGIFLAALTTAGRQAPLQLVMMTLFIESFRSQRLPRGSDRGYRIKFAVLGLAAIMIIYVTINRTSADYSSKADVFLRLFQSWVDPHVDNILLRFGDGVRDVVIEAILYLSHTVPLFAISSEIDYGGPYFGAMNFPFIMRQLQPIIGINPQDVLSLKIFSINAERVIGVGWDTALSGLIMDFGIPGMMIAMGLFGYAGQRVITKVHQGGSLPQAIIAAELMLTAAYTPYFSALADTNLLFLLVACALMARFVPAPRRQPPSVAAAPSCPSA